MTASSADVDALEIVPSGAFTALAACSKSETPGAKAEGRVPGVSVIVAQVTARDVPVRVRAIGNVLASATVSVLAQIGGEITKIHFKEGQDVATGDLLFTIDPRTFEAALQQARAQLAQHAALRKPPIVLEADSTLVIRTLESHMNQPQPA